MAKDYSLRGMTKEQRFVKFGCSERFEYVGEVDKFHVNVKCRSCGYVFTREVTFLHSGSNHNIECRKCGIHADGTRTSVLSEVKRGMDESIVVDYYLAGNSATQTAIKFGMNLRRVRRIIDEAGVSRDKQMVMVFEDYPDELTGDPWMDEEFTCEECGRVFTRHQYMVAVDRTSMMYKAPRFCSFKCRNKAGNRNGRSHRKERRSEVRKGDVIPLGDLMERDGGICQICHEPVDVDDGYFDAGGHFHTGKSYPTVDHIKPLAKGGLHVWENVQLAHQACNSWKCDRMPEELSA